MLRTKRLPLAAGIVALWLLGGMFSSFGAGTRHLLHGHVPAVVARLTALGFFPATNQVRLAIGLPLRNTNELDELLRQIYNPASPNFRRYLTPEEFTAQFGPTESDYAAVRNFAQTNGFAVTATHGNRLLLDVTGSEAAGLPASQGGAGFFRAGQRTVGAGKSSGGGHQRAGQLFASAPEACPAVIDSVTPRGFGPDRRVFGKRFSRGVCAGNRAGRLRTDGRAAAV